MYVYMYIYIYIYMNIDEVRRAVLQVGAYLCKIACNSCNRTAT